jgi:hypothetical protein
VGDILPFVIGGLVGVVLVAVADYFGERAARRLEQLERRSNERANQVNEG